MLSIIEEYQYRCKMPSDINEHLPVLHYLACMCGHVTEFGTRYGNSTVALLAAMPKRFVCYDIAPLPLHLKPLVFVSCEVDMIQDDTLKLSRIEATDLLFIDTLHTEEQLRAELRFAPQVRKFIVLHDTETFRWHGERADSRGLGYALLDFLMGNPEWRIYKHYPNNNGLTILKRLTIGA